MRSLILEEGLKLVICEKLNYAITAGVLYRTNQQDALTAGSKHKIENRERRDSLAYSLEYKS